MTDFDAYEDPVGRPATAPSSEPQVGYGEDIGKGAVGGLARGVTGLIGGAGSVGTMARGIADRLLSPENAQRAANVAHALGYVLPPFALWSNAPDAGQVQNAVEGVTGKFYEPKTLPGQYASTIAEFAPAAAVGGETLPAKILNTVAPAVVSETLGQYTKGTAAEPYARFVGGVIGGPAVAKAITPTAAPSAARAAMVATLEREGVPLTAAQRTGSNPLNYLESNAADMPLSAGKAAEIRANQANAFDQAVTAKLFDRGELTARGVPEDVNLPDERAWTAGRESLSDEYTRLHQNDFVSDPQLHRDMYAARNAYEAGTLPFQRVGGSSSLDNIHNQIVDELVAGQGRMTGEKYQSIRSTLSDEANTAFNNNQSKLGAALKSTRTALDRAFERGLSPADAMALRINNQRYANMKQLTNAVARGGENLSPLAVAQTARTGRASQFAAQASDLDRLARAGSQIMKQPPNSGTAARLGWQTLFTLPNMISSGGGGLLGTVLGGPLGGLAGAALPQLASRAAISRPAQAYFANQWLPQNARDVVTQALTQQAISQPSGIAGNIQEQMDYEQRRKQRRIQQGLPPD